MVFLVNFLSHCQSPPRDITIQVIMVKHPHEANLSEEQELFQEFSDGNARNLPRNGSLFA